MNALRATLTAGSMIILAVAVIMMCSMGLWAVAGRPDTGQQLQEDDPGWDCHTMGNRQC